MLPIRPADAFAVAARRARRKVPRDALREARATARLLRQRAAGWQNAALVWRAAAAAAALGALVALKMAQRRRG